MIIHQYLPLKPWMEPRTRRLPGLFPVGLQDWLACDEVYDQQIQLRDRLISEKRDQVYQTGKDTDPHKHPAAIELLACLTKELSAKRGYQYTPPNIKRPDGAMINCTSDDPLIIAARLVQEDLLILEEKNRQHYLTNAVLCFPASWTLAQKIDKPLGAIHEPVTRYTDNITNRVNRIFDHIHPEQPVMRANFLLYDDPALHQPRLENQKKTIDPKAPLYVRVERQTLRRLPKTRAIVFAVHTYLVKEDSLTDQERTTLRAAIQS